MNRNFSFSRILTLLEGFKTTAMGGRDAQSLSGRAARSGVWIGGGFVVQRGLQFASNLTLTRLLFPEAFGLMALCTVFLVGIAMFSDLGIKPAIIRDPRGTESDFLNTAWTINVIRGFVLFAGGCLLAYPISIIYDQAILLPLLAVLSTTAAISGFVSIKIYTAERDLDFRTITFIQIIGQVVQILTMVVLAYYWRSVWALAIGVVVGSLTVLVISHFLLRGHHHRLHIDPASSKSLVQFGKWIFISTIVTFLGGEGLRAIQAGFITPAEFGILSIAYTIATIPIDLALKLTDSIGMPAISQTFRTNPENLSAVLNNFRKRVLAVSLILVSALVITSEPLISVLYDERYHTAASLVVAIMLSNAIGLIFAGYNNALLAVGKSDTYFLTMVFSAVARIAGTVAGFKTLGIIGMIIGLGVANLIVLFFVWIIMYRQRLLNLKLDIVAILAIAVLGYITIELY